MTESLATDNYNILWSQLIIRELKRHGCRGFFVSPGYRNAPLVAALRRENVVDVISCPDERAGAYQALGYAKATGTPAVLMCTSGTAAANYFPAVIEAATDQIPLVVISADRPFALVNSGANQVIDQRDLFGRFVKQALTFPTPSPAVTAASILRIVNDSLVQTLRHPRGPVHWNIPFDEPLEPRPSALGPVAESYASTAEEEWQTWHQMTPSPLGETGEPAARDVHWLAERMNRARRGLLLVGSLACPKARQQVRQLAEMLGWPTYFDITSGLRFPANRLTLLDVESPNARNLLAAYEPDFVVHFGRLLTSKWFDRFLQGWHPALGYCVVTQNHRVQDPIQKAIYQISTDEGAMAHQLLELIDQSQQDENLLFHDETILLRRKVSQKLAGGPFSSATLAAVVLENISGDEILYLGNSSTIRAFDSWGIDGPEHLDVRASRGVSGIEGQLATAMGFARASGRAVTAVVGDITLIHDLNSLLELGRSGLPVTLIVVNNQEGAIFGRMPIGRYPDVLTPLLNTPHDFQFESIAAMARLAYVRVDCKAVLQKVYHEGRQRGLPMLIECVVNAREDADFIQELLQT